MNEAQGRMKSQSSMIASAKLKLNVKINFTLLDTTKRKQKGFASQIKRTMFRNAFFSSVALNNNVNLDLIQTQS
jgi:hypothetical protein